jgi:hypothetical protein
MKTKPTPMEAIETKLSELTDLHEAAARCELRSEQATDGSGGHYWRTMAVNRYRVTKRLRASLLRRIKALAGKGKA